MTGIGRRPCLGLPGRPCRNLVRGASRCAVCASDLERDRENRRAEARRLNEPWRFLYTLAVWRKARDARLALDRRRCVDCGSRQNVSVDHEVPLRDLYEQHPARANFIAAATDVERLRCRCASCHGTIEASRRRAALNELTRLSEDLPGGYR